MVTAIASASFTRNEIRMLIDVKQAFIHTFPTGSKNTEGFIYC
jgi:hypothetical protein